MTNNAIVSQIEQALRGSKFDCSTHEATEEVPQDRLLVFIGHDGQLRERIIEITAQKQDMKDDKSIVQIQYIVVLPFECLDTCVSDTGNLLHFLNRQAELPGFELDELNNLILFRHVALNINGTAIPELSLAIIGLITMTLDLFTEPIEQVCSGKMTYDELLSKTLELFSSTK